MLWKAHHNLTRRLPCSLSARHSSSHQPRTSSALQGCRRNHEDVTPNMISRVNGAATADGLFRGCAQMAMISRRNHMSQTHFRTSDCIHSTRAIWRRASSSSSPPPPPKASQSSSSSATGMEGKSWLNLPQVVNPNNRFMTQPLVSDLSLAVMAGHLAFVMMGMAYVTKDVLNLRLLAMTSISLTSIFQYYRPTPLFIPLRWNALFLAVNTVMAALLWEERHASNRMSPELQRIYREGKFEERGISKVEFFKLFRVGTRIQYKPHEQKEKFLTLTRANEPNGKLYYIADGKGHMERSGQLIARLEPHDFVGEMEFVAYRSEEQASKDASAFPKPRVDVLLALPNDGDDDGGGGGGETTTIWVWDFQALSEYLSKHRDVNNALLAYISHELCEKLTDSWDVSTAENQKQLDDKSKIVEAAA